MAARRQRQKGQPTVAGRVLNWVVVSLAWRLPKGMIQIVLWSARSFFSFWPRPSSKPVSADRFYRSYAWRKLRVEALEANRARYGMLACECCGMVHGKTFHVDHIYPRSTHPDLALDADNLQVLCDDCNIGKGTHYTTNWRGGRMPEPIGRRGWRRFLVWP